MAPDPSDALPAVSITALGVASVRAAESERPDRLFADPFASAFVAAARSTPPSVLTPAQRGRASALVNWITVRTRFFDELMLHACAHSCGQVVILAAGLDARAFRLGLMADVRLFEIDLDEILAFKQDVITANGFVPSCERVVVPADLSGPWLPALADAGFDPGVPTMWLAEGLLVYLTRQQNEKLIDDVSDASSPGSRLGLTLSSRNEGQARTGGNLFEHERLQQSASPGDAADWLGPRGWSVEVHLATDRAPAYGRRAAVTDTPTRGRLVDATRLG
ncbi:MAG: SAM-dependent methyltransferase [Acidimicrobiia bacterium]